MAYRGEIAAKGGAPLNRQARATLLRQAAADRLSAEKASAEKFAAAATSIVKKKITCITVIDAERPEESQLSSLTAEVEPKVQQETIDDALPRSKRSKTQINRLNDAQCRRFLPL